VSLKLLRFSHACPELLQGMSPKLKKRMQGKVFFKRKVSNLLNFNNKSGQVQIVRFLF